MKDEELVQAAKGTKFEAFCTFSNLRKMPGWIKEELEMEIVLLAWKMSRLSGLQHEQDCYIRRLIASPSTRMNPKMTWQRTGNLHRL